MKKVIGYVLAIGGLVVLAVGIGTIKLELEILKTIKPLYISGIGAILIIAGAISLRRGGGSGNSKQASEEVPIYEGKKIVGYRRSE